jgi:hypothetical protein
MIKTFFYTYFNEETQTGGGVMSEKEIGSNGLTRRKFIITTRWIFPFCPGDLAPFLNIPSLQPDPSPNIPQSFPLYFHYPSNSIRGIRHGRK